MEFMTNINDRISTLETKNTVLNQQHLIPGQFPVATGMLPQATGHLPHATGLAPQATGIIPQTTGLMPQKSFASPPIKTIQQNMVPLNTSSPLRPGLNSVGNYSSIATVLFINKIHYFSVGGKSTQLLYAATFKHCKHFSHERPVGERQHAPGFQLSSRSKEKRPKEEKSFE